jgi:hypothetical protein
VGHPHLQHVKNLLNLSFLCFVQFHFSFLLYFKEGGDALVAGDRVLLEAGYGRLERSKLGLKWFEN